MYRVFLTGASGGIGEALAKHYAARGATLGLVGRRRDVLEKLRESVGVPVEIYPADVREHSAMKAAAEDFMAKHGVPDLVIGNAGVSIGTLTESAEDINVFREILDINVVGLVNTVQPFLAEMRYKRSGRIVGIASVAGYRGLPGAAAYSASKAAAIRYLESLRVELRHTGVMVTTICPGYIATPMTAKNPYPMPFILTADDFAQRFTDAIDAHKSYAVIPWQMAIVARILTLMPNWLYDAVFARAGRKPRRS